MKLRQLIIAGAMTLGMTLTVFAAPMTGKVVLPDGSPAAGVECSVIESSTGSAKKVLWEKMGHTL